MKKFVLRLLLASLLFVTVVVGMHVVTIFRQKPIADAVYSLKPTQDVLAIGSSEVGCSIVEHERYHNRVIWISNTTVFSFLMRLQELERRGQLDGVKVLIVPFDLAILLVQTYDTIKWSWYQELSVSWRYMDSLPCGKLELVAYIASNLRWPFHLHLRENPPIRPPLSARPAKWREDFMRSECSTSLTDPFKALPSGWDDRLDATYAGIAEICKRRKIRLVAVQVPLLSQYRMCQPSSVLEAERDWIARLKNMGYEYCTVTNRFDESVFFDTRHLVATGAEVFTEAVYKELKLKVNLTRE